MTSIAMPAPAGVPAAGQVMLAVLAFSVIVWMTEALDYAVSAVVIVALMIFLLGFGSDAATPAGPLMGTGAALNLALSGFANSAVALGAAACFIAAAMTARRQKSGLQPGSEDGCPVDPRQAPSRLTKLAFEPSIHGGYQNFSEPTVARLRFIRAAVTLGFKPNDVELLRMSDRGHLHCPKARETLAERLPVKASNDGEPS